MQRGMGLKGSSAAAIFPCSKVIEREVPPPSLASRLVNPLKISFGPCVMSGGGVLLLEGEDMQVIKSSNVFAIS